ncbi:hypothetical protein MKZ38_008627 [Zalerion maritima]|uniref:UBC core domain-containing protein n=1 Tax=Zalerion maritima TaxID=339359 RepID=A0AAD5RYV3_9PEZI|nr:hypothetical protein MKZ38_008627 [Zalerion maritima]
MASFASKRLAKELSKLNNDTHKLPPGIELVSTETFEEWLVDIRVLDDNPLYKGEMYRLKFRFSASYPIEPPEVVFCKTADRPIPIHPHIYSNGIICLDLLGQQGWSPVQNVESVCMSIQSMLTGNSKNERPPGDEEFVRASRALSVVEAESSGTRDGRRSEILMPEYTLAFPTFALRSVLLRVIVWRTPGNW